MSDVSIFMATMMRWIDAISKFPHVPNASASLVSAWPSSPSFRRIGAVSAARMPSIAAVCSTFTFILQLWVHELCYENQDLTILLGTTQKKKVKLCSVQLD